MRSLNIWQLFHTYQRLAEQSKAAGLRCPDDDEPVVTRMKPKNTDDIYLWCPKCQSWSRPGLDLIRRVEAVVKEHYDVVLDLG